MSWLNISGNLSNLANNVTSFTKEVLTEANREDDSLPGEQDIQEDPLKGDFNPALRDELLFLRSDVNSKDEHITYLQQEVEKLKDDFQKHTSNLKHHLLQKDQEIDAYAEKLNQSELRLQERINDLTNDKSQLEGELAERMSHSETDNESDWGNDWGGNNDLEVSNLKEENESLSNEVSMKEIILNSIESKMRQISGGKHVDASDFATWIDDYLQEAKQEQEKASNMTELVMYLKEEMNDDSDNDNIDLDEVYDWISSKKEEKIVLERKITKLENTIVSIEDSIKNYEKGLKTFKIADFDDWLASFSSKISPREESPIEKTSPSESNNKIHTLLMSIQESIREFDEEDSDFEINNFQVWIEKVQNRIDDLEVDLLNEQEIKESQEKQRADERAKLKELFDEKEKEISHLKVELYNNTNMTVQGGGSSEIQSDNASALKEQLNEAVARCEALQDELVACKNQNSNALENQKLQLHELTKINEETKVLLDIAQNEKQILEQQLEDSEQTVSSQKMEIDTIQTGNSSSTSQLVEENQQLKSTVESLPLDNVNSSDVSLHLQEARQEIGILKTNFAETTEQNTQLMMEITNICSDISNMESMVMSVVNREHDASKSYLEPAFDKQDVLSEAGSK